LITFKTGKCVVEGV